MRGWHSGGPARDLQAGVRRKFPDPPPEPQTVQRPPWLDRLEVQATNRKVRVGGARMGRRISIPLIVSPHTASSFKTVCWTRGPVSSPAHVQDHEPRDGGPRQGLGRTAARAILDTPLLARRSAPPAGDTASAHSLPRPRCVRRACHVGDARAAHGPARPRFVASRAAGTRRAVRRRALCRMVEVLVDTGDSVAARTVGRPRREPRRRGDCPATCGCSIRASSNQRPRVMTSRSIVTRRCVKEIRCRPTSRRYDSVTRSR